MLKSLAWRPITPSPEEIAMTRPPTFGAGPRAHEAPPRHPDGFEDCIWSPRPSGAVPIGVVRFATHRGRPARAILDAAGRWRCPELPVLDRVLNALYPPEDRTEEEPFFGHVALHRVAAWLRGTVQRRDEARDGPG